jgi:hypothetical protein
MTTLDEALLAAHAKDDRKALVHLYAKAADIADSVDSTSFYLTHAYVFALEAGLPIADILRVRLVQMGREVD